MEKDYLAAQYPTPEMPFRHVVIERKERFIRRYGILLVVAAVFTIYTIILSAFVNRQAVMRTRQEYDVKFEQWQADYRRELQEE